MSPRGWLSSKVATKFLVIALKTYRYVLLCTTPYELCVTWYSVLLYFAYCYYIVAATVACVVPIVVVSARLGPVRFGSETEWNKKKTRERIKRETHNRTHSHLYESPRNSSAKDGWARWWRNKELRAPHKLDVMRDIQKGSGPVQYLWPRLPRFLSGNYDSRPCRRCLLLLLLRVPNLIALLP